jgi:hypothetical protein
MAVLGEKEGEAPKETYSGDVKVAWCEFSSLDALLEQFGKPGQDDTVRFDDMLPQDRVHLRLGHHEGDQSSFSSADVTERLADAGKEFASCTVAQVSHGGQHLAGEEVLP